MFYTYQIILWLVFLLFISSKIKKNNRRILFTVVASFFSTLEIVAVYMTERFIDYRFYNHMNINAIEGHGFQFLTQMISFTVLFILISVVFYFVSKKMNISSLRHNKYFIPAVLTSFILLSLPNGVFSETYKIYEILDAEEKSFNQALTDIGIPPTKYITPDQLTAKKGKNIIVISLESLEQGFLGKNFDNILPNLSRLSKEWTFYNQMPQSAGGDWTAASLYNHQVGMPAFFKGQGNDFFQGIIDVKLTGLGHILNKAGYNSKYIVGNAEFAGMSDILKAYGIPTVSQDNALGTYPKVRNGFNDYDLFKEAKLQIKEFQKDDDKPFALFLSTVNTHFPKGIYDKRMEQFISNNKNNLEFSASALDYLVNDLLFYLKENNLLKNTAIYIFPDHQLMGNSGPVHEKLRKSIRQLYLLTNVKENKLPKQTSNTIYQIDLPRMIIDGAEIKTNATFLVDFINNEDIQSFLEKNRVKLTTLNTASVAKQDYMQGININIIDNNLTIQSDTNNKKIALNGMKISITSSELTTSKKISSLIKAGGKEFGLSRGLNLLTVNHQGKFTVENYDTYGSKDATNQFIIKLESLIKNQKFWAISAHDAIKSDWPGFEEKLSELNFKLLQTLNGRMAYIAYSDNNNVIKEYSSKSSLTHSIFYTKNKEEVFDFTFNPEMVLIGQRKVNAKNTFDLHPFDKEHNRLHLIVFVKDGKVYKAYFGNKQMIGLYKEGEIISFSKEDIKLIVESNNMAVPTTIPTFQYDPLVVSITSSELTTSKKISSLIKAGGKEFGLSRGLNLLTVNHQGKFTVENYDTYGSQDATNQFIIKLESLIKNQKFWAISAHDAIKSDWPGFEEKLSELNLKLLQTLNGRMAYIAYSDNNNAIKEYSSKTSLSYIIPCFISPISKEELELLKKQEHQNNIEANLYRKNTNRFIAHAGGSIEGYKYTNSLDAININYKNGFRLFELDIIKTSDDIYVAAHDWKHWAKITGYLGELPPDRETFKKQKIYKKYTSMDMTDINKWFKDHPDAILVTDKVNMPKDFSEKFIDKNRLIMELFTWNAVKEGISAKIKSPMPTGAILSKIKGDKIAYLKELGITDIASSRRIINGQKAFVKSIVDSGINIYAFHLHFDKGTDEKYVACEERNYFYGMYADMWDFKADLNCSNYAVIK